MKLILMYTVKYLSKQKYFFFFILSLTFLISTVSCQGCLSTLLGQNEVSSSVTNIYVDVDIFKTNAPRDNIQLAVDINKAVTLSTNALYEHHDNLGQLLGKVEMYFPKGIVPSLLFDSLLNNSSIGTNFIISNQVGEESTVDITVTNLPRGLKLRVNVALDPNTDEIHKISLIPLGNAISHVSPTDNVDSLAVVFSKNLFVTKSKVLNQFTNDVIAVFDIVFGNKRTLPRWTARHEHQVFSHDNKLWLLGGNVNYSDRNGRTNDIWVSADHGTNWQVVVASASWERRSEYQAFVYSNNLYVLGGRGHSSIQPWFSNVWSSYNGNNGLNWVRVLANAPWSGRLDHQVLVNSSTILLLGGLALNSPLIGRRINDVWKSVDGGSTWTEVTGDAGWSARYGHQAIRANNKIWVLGGNALSGLSSGATNDVWRSSDEGQNWLSMTVSASWTARENHQSFFAQNKLWVIGGSLNNDVWYSSDDGQSWQSATLNAEWQPRQSHQSFFYDGKLWVVGGKGVSGALYNDIWFSTNGGTNWITISTEQGEFYYE